MLTVTPFTGLVKLAIELEPDLIHTDYTEFLEFEYAWYHNGSEITQATVPPTDRDRSNLRQPGPSERIRIASNGLCIDNVVYPADAGVYEAKVAHLHVNDDSYYDDGGSGGIECNLITLQVLQKYAVVAPVTFYISPPGK